MRGLPEVSFELYSKKYIPKTLLMKCGLQAHMTTAYLHMSAITDWHKTHCSCSHRYIIRTLCLALVSWHCMADDTPHNNVSQLGMLSLGCPLKSHTSLELYKALIARLDML